MRRRPHREIVELGGPPPGPPLAVVVTEVAPGNDVVALEPRPAAHSPVDVVLAMPVIEDLEPRVRTEEIAPLDIEAATREAQATRAATRRS